jgi:hypothetical protein
MPKQDGKRYFYYSCASRRKGNRASLREDNLSSCFKRKSHRSERIELALWYLASALLTDPEGCTLAWKWSKAGTPSWSSTPARCRRS